MIVTEDGYPAHAIGGSDFLTGAAQRVISDVDGNGNEIRRPERIVVTDREIPETEILDGVVCLSEQTIRTLGGLVGLADEPHVKELTRRMRIAVDERDRFEAEAIRLAAQLHAKPATVYVAADGTEHASLESARAATAPQVPLPPATVGPLPTGV